MSGREHNHANRPLDYPARALDRLPVHVLPSLFDDQGSRPINPAAKSRTPPATAFGIRHVLSTGCAWRMLPQVRPRPGAPVQSLDSDPRQLISGNDGKRGPRGYGADKEVKGRKRHLAVDTQSLLLALTRLQVVWEDAGYAGPIPGDRVQATLPWNLEIVRPPEPGTDFQLLPRRWAVDRTFAWLGRHRHLSKNYEVLLEAAIAWIHAAMTGLTLRHLAQN